MKKVLFTATVDSHILQFHIPYLKMLKEKGYEVHVATNGTENIPYCDVKHVVSFERSPIKINNLKAIKQLKKIIDKEKFEIIHCHTPMGSVVTRLAAKKARKKGTKVIYTAHGFHFYKGAPLINWMIFYPIEKYLSQYTDCLITINDEDYELARKKFKKCEQIELIYGVGVDENKFNFKMTDQEKHELRKSLGLRDDDFVIIYVAELSKRKNQGMLIQAVKELIDDGKNNIKVILPGTDSMNGYYQKMSKDLGLEDNIKFLGYRKDIPKLLKISDLYVSTAKQEGLPVNIMEAMTSNIPIIATDCRGNRDLIKSCIEIDNIAGLAKNIQEKSTMRELAYEYNMLQYSTTKIVNIMERIYDCFNKRNKLAIITSGFLPVPATKGGAAENLIDILVYKNEKYNEVSPVIISTYDVDAVEKSKKIKNSKFIFLKPNKLATLIDKFNYFIIDKILKKKNSRKFRYFFQRLDFFYKCSIVLKKNNYDKILLENHTIMYLALKLRKNYLKYSDRYYYHCHNAVPSMFNMEEIIRNTKKFISVSNFRNNYLKNLLNLPSEKCSVVFNCCSNDIYKKATEDELKKLKNKYDIENEKIILYIGRIDKDKGTLQLIKACNRILNNKFKLIIVGAPIFATGITTEYEKQVKEEVSKNPEKYIMTGYVPHNELYKYYSLADVIAIPSQVEDSAPLVLIEALVSGKPIVASKCGGIPEYVNSECSILIETNKKYCENFGIALEKIINDEPLNIKMKKASIEKAKDYSEDKYYQDFIKALFL